MTSYAQLLWGGFAASVVFGGAAQSSRFCPQGGLREAMIESRAQRLAAYFAAVGFALLAVAALQLALGAGIEPSHPPYRSVQMAWGRYVLGGLLFGSGMVLARGCPLRMAVRSAEGSAHSLLLLAVMAFAAFAMTSTFVFNDWVAPWIGRLSVDLARRGWQGQGLDAALGLHGTLARSALGAVIGSLVLAISARRLRGRGNVERWIGSALIGLMVAAGYWLTAGPIGGRATDDASFMSLPPDGLGVQSFSYAGPLSDAARYVQHPQAQTFTLAIVLLLGTIVGALATALLRGEFRLEWPAISRATVVQLLGALMTGAGAVLGLGCTVGHGLSGVAVLSLGSIMALVAIFAGAWATIRLGAPARRANSLADQAVAEA